MTRSYRHKILFVRHGQTAYNAENRLQGQRDVPLNGKGREQAGAVGRFLAGALGAELARLEAIGGFWASPLRRTRETMALAREAMGLPRESYQRDARLMELTFGDWEGLTWSEVEAKYPTAAKARERDKWNFAPPAGESYAALVERVTPWLDERESDVFVVAHGGVARAFMAILAGVPAPLAASADIWQGRALIFDKGECSWVG